MDQIQNKPPKWWFGENPINWSKSETKLAVLAIIFQESRKQNQTIAATSISQIKAGLKKFYNKDLSQRHILHVIQSLGKIILKEKDPRDQRKTLYRINPSVVEEMMVTLIKLNNESKHESTNFDWILCEPFSPTDKRKFLGISHKHKINLK